MEGIIPAHKVALDGVYVDADRFDISGLNLIEEFAEVQRPIGFRVAAFDHGP